MRCLAHLLVLPWLALLGCGDDSPDPCAKTTTWTVPSVAGALAELDALGFDAFVDSSFAALLRREPEVLSELALSESFGLDHSQLEGGSSPLEVLDGVVQEWIAAAP